MSDFCDAAPSVMEFLINSMKIDNIWHLKEERGFKWWPHRFAQRVWAELPRKSEGLDITVLHAETDFLHHVPRENKTREFVNVLNIYASQSAFVWNQEEGHIKLHSAVCIHRENIEWVKRLFMSSVALQAADSHIKADKLANLINAKPTTSSHPQSGIRNDPDDMLNVIEQIYIPAGVRPSVVPKLEFESAAELSKKYFLAFGGDSVFSIEFPFFDKEPVIAKILEDKYPTETPPVGTALFVADSRERHPHLGGGLWTRLHLPLTLDNEQGPHLAFVLNRAEAENWTSCHLLGAWCYNKNRLSFVSFLPNVAYKPGILINLVMSNYIRTNWVKDYIQSDLGLRN